VTVGRDQDTAKLRRQAGIEAKPLNRIAAIGAVQYNRRGKALIYDCFPHML
jgi:hypothetical protein